jgi:hypothetical protein
MLAQRSSSALALSASRQAARRNLSSQPKMHKVKDHWQNLKSKRPIDQDDLHLTFHPPYNKGTVLLVIGGAVAIGYGSTTYSFVHQQYKQGYWK